MLEKTLESPLDCKEIQPVHSEGDQPWDFFCLSPTSKAQPELEQYKKFRQVLVSYFSMASCSLEFWLSFELPHIRFSNTELVIFLPLVLVRA